MDNALIFLGIALLIAVVGGLVVMLLHRDPEASADGVEEFQRIMSALAPDGASPEQPTEPGPASASDVRPVAAPPDAVASEGSGDGS